MADPVGDRPDFEKPHHEEAGEADGEAVERVAKALCDMDPRVLESLARGDTDRDWPLVIAVIVLAAAFPEGVVPAGVARELEREREETRLEEVLTYAEITERAERAERAADALAEGLRELLGYIDSAKPDTEAVWTVKFNDTMSVRARARDLLAQHDEKGDDGTHGAS